jgi:hypothetical protein
VGNRALIGVAAALALFSACSRKPASAVHSRRAKPVVGTILDGAEGRKIFPYSVIPGGVDSISDIQNAVRRDPVVAAHYSLLKVSSLQKTELSQPFAAYVSFRIGTKVYWTARKLNIARGETVFLDRNGNGVRGRCGNQLSRLPMTPITEITRIEPTPQTLDTPVAPLPPSVPAAAPVPTEIGNLLAPQETPPPIASPTIAPPSESAPVYQPIYGFPGGTIGGVPPTTVVPPPGVVQPPAPELPVVPILPVQFGPAPTVPTGTGVIPPFGYQPVVPGTPTIPVLSPPTAPGTPGMPPPPVLGPPGTPTTPTPPTTPPPTPPGTPPTPPGPPLTPPTPPEMPPVTPPDVTTPEPATWLLIAGGLGVFSLLRRKRL